MTKLRVFEQDHFEKLLFIDADMLIVRPLDDIFEDHGTRVETLPANASSQPDAASLPPSYMLAGQAQQRTRQHPENENWFCSGFFVFSPSREIFNYYLSLLALPNRFDPFYPDQNLLNYAHRWDGPMPWTKFNYTWTTTFPTIKEYEMGAASLHEKYWLEEYRKEEFGQDVLGEMWLETKGNMTAFYQHRDGNMG